MLGWFRNRRTNPRDLLFQQFQEMGIVESAVGQEEVVKEHNAVAITQIIEGVSLGHAAAPPAKHVEMGGLGVQQEPLVHGSVAAIQIVGRHTTCALAKIFRPLTTNVQGKRVPAAPSLKTISSLRTPNGVAWASSLRPSAATSELRLVKILSPAPLGHHKRGLASSIECVNCGSLGNM